MTPILLSALLLTAPPRDILANNAFFYYADLNAAWRFYTEKIGLETVADYGFAKILQVAETSFLILVDASKGMHSAAEPKTVAMALVTDELEEWFAHLKSHGVPMRGDPMDLEPVPIQSLQDLLEVASTAASTFHSFDMAPPCRHSTRKVPTSQQR